MSVIRSEWEFISLLFSASTTQPYLLKKYETLGYSDAKEASYLNCSTFIHYLEHAYTHYKSAETVPHSIRPNLLFYGYTQLLKACLLTVDPFYPSSTALLAHGVSTRKRKKKQYEFLNDEIKIQKDGLFSFMAEKMFHMKHLENDKLSMQSLLAEIPEMCDQMQYFQKPGTFAMKKAKEGIYKIHSGILKAHNITADGFTAFISDSLNQKLVIEEAEHYLYLYAENTFQINIRPPFRYNMITDEYHISSQKKENSFLFSDIMIQYLLLYNLSMIARYETDWWLDLLKTTPNEDYPLIMRFMDIAQQKGPFLINQWLKKECI